MDRSCHPFLPKPLPQHRHLHVQRLGLGGTQPFRRGAIRYLQNQYYDAAISYGEWFSSALCARYAGALARFGVTGATGIEEAAVAGLWRIATAAGLVTRRTTETA